MGMPISQHKLQLVIRVASPGQTGDFFTGYCRSHVTNNKTRKTAILMRFYGRLADKSKNFNIYNLNF